MVRVSVHESAAVRWALQFESAKRFFDRLSVKKSGLPHARRNYALGLREFYDWSGMTPDDIVNQWRKDSTMDYEQALEDWDVKLDQFLKWLMDKDTGKGEAVNYHTAIKSLIKYNSKLRLNIGTPSKGIVSSWQPLTLEEVKQLDAVCDEQQRFIIRALKDSGMSQEDFAELNYGDIRKEFEVGQQFVHIRACFALRRTWEKHEECALVN